MKPTLNDFYAFLRENFTLFIERSFNELNPNTKLLWNWHIDAIAYELELCRLGLTKRLIINLPPRNLKSHCASVAFVAWLLGHCPSAQIMCASYAQDLADKHARDCRTVMMSNWYQNSFPTRLSASKQAIADFTTIQKGGRRATSVGGVVTGLGADFIIIDDPLKPDEAISEVRRKTVNEWYDHSLSSRLNDKRNGCIILIMQRLHEDDLTGHLLKSGGWKILCLPAIAEEDENTRSRLFVVPAA